MLPLFLELLSLYRQWSESNPEVSHRKGLAIARQALDLPLDERQRTQMLRGVGGFYRAIGLFDEAAHCFGEQLSIQIKTLGEEHHLVASTYNNLAKV